MANAEKQMKKNPRLNKPIEAKNKVVAPKDSGLGLKPMDARCASTISHPVACTARATRNAVRFLIAHHTLSRRTSGHEFYCRDHVTIQLLEEMTDR